MFCLRAYDAKQGRPFQRGGVVQTGFAALLARGWHVPGGSHASGGGFGLKLTLCFGLALCFGPALPGPADAQSVGDGTEPVIVPLPDSTTAAPDASARETSPPAPDVAPPDEAQAGGTSPLSAEALTPNVSPPSDDPAGAAQQLGGLWTLDRLLDEIVTQNPRIKGQSAVAAGAKYDVSAARWQYFPSPSLQAETAGNDRQLVAAVTQPLLSFGRLSADLQSAKSKAVLAETRVEEARYLLAFRVIDLFGQFAAARRGADVMQDDIARLSALGDMIQRRVAGGVSAPIDLNLVLTRIRQSENAAIGLRARQANAVTALAELLGKPLDGSQIALPLASDLDQIMTTPVAPDVVRQSLAHNPVLRRTEGEVDVAQLERQRAASAVKPTLYARVEHRFDYGKYENSAFPATRALLGIQYSFGSGLSAFDRIKTASAQADAARLARDAAVADARSAIRNDLEILNSSRELVVSLRANLASQEETVASYHRLFLAGKRSWLDVLNMVRELTGSQRDLAEAEIQTMLAAYRIQLQTGQLKW